MTKLAFKQPNQIKTFYSKHHDKITEKRFTSPFAIRRYAHNAQYEMVMRQVTPGESVLDAGCGEGTIGLLLAKRGIESVGVDLSLNNVQAAMDIALENGLQGLVEYSQGDAEHLPFADKSFDVVISSHVLEHLPDFDKGWQELCRVARKRIVVALPTCLNPCAWALLGGDYGFWRFSRKSIFTIAYGLLRVILNVFNEGVQEGYAGKNDIPHIWRYPWAIKHRLRHPQWKMVSYEASSFCLPYLEILLPLTRLMERFRALSVLRHFGYGSTMVFEPYESRD